MPLNIFRSVERTFQCLRRPRRDTTTVPTGRYSPLLHFYPCFFQPMTFRPRLSPKQAAIFCSISTDVTCPKQSRKGATDGQTANNEINLMNGGRDKRAKRRRSALIRDVRPMKVAAESQNLFRGAKNNLRTKANSNSGSPLGGCEVGFERNEGS